MNRIMMKKVVTTALAGAMAFSITACGSAGAAGKETAASTEATAAQEMTDNSAGGWELNTGALSIDENSAAKAAFQKATEGMVGYEYEVIALLGTQVVAGTNYSILVKGNAVVPDAQPVYEIITIYEDLEGNARITDSRTLTDGEEEKAVGGGAQGFANVQIPNPFEDFAALEGAADAAGFELSVPDAPEEYQTVLYRASADLRMIEVIYCNKSIEAEDSAEAYRIRKAVGSDDISGDYNDYKEINKVTVGNNTVTLKGNNSKVYTAVWTSGEYTYAINIDMAGQGLSADEVIAIASAVK